MIGGRHVGREHKGSSKSDCLGGGRAKGITGSIEGDHQALYTQRIPQGNPRKQRTGIDKASRTFPGKRGKKLQSNLSVGICQYIYSSRKGRNLIVRPGLRGGVR